MKTKRPIGSSGFTIIELMIATIVFSIILIVITAGIIQFTNQYYKGVTASNTQTAARTIVDAVTQDIQFSPKGANAVTLTETSPTPGAPYGFCAGGHLYSYQLGYELTSSSKHVLIQNTDVPSNSCASDPVTPDSLNAGALGDSKHELLGDKMRLSKFSVTQVGNSQLYTLTVRVAYGDDDLLYSPSSPPNSADGDKKEDATCKSQAGSQFCAVSELSTTIEKRL